MSMKFPAGIQNPPWITTQQKINLDKKPKLADNTIQL